MGYDICEFNSLGGWEIHIIDRVRFDYRVYQQTANKCLTSDFWQFIEPWHRGWYDYGIDVVLCTENVHGLEKERCSFGEVADHNVIYWSKAAERLSAFNLGLVFYVLQMK